MKREQLRLNLPYPEADYVRTLSEQTGLSMADISLTLLLSAIRAAKERGPALTLPVSFVLAGPSPHSLNETSASPIVYSPPRARR